MPQGLTNVQIFGAAQLADERRNNGIHRQVCGELPKMARWRESIDRGDEHERNGWGSIGLGAGLSVSGGNLVAKPASASRTTPTRAGRTFCRQWSGHHVHDQRQRARYRSHEHLPVDRTAHVLCDGGEDGRQRLWNRDPADAQPAQRNEFRPDVFGNETVTQAGTGNQYPRGPCSVGGTDEWIVTSTGPGDPREHGTDQRLGRPTAAPERSMAPCRETARALFPWPQAARASQSPREE